MPINKNTKTRFTGVFASGAIFTVLFFLATIGRGESTQPLKILSVVAGARYTCAVLSDGTVKCWGINFPKSVIQNLQTGSPPLTITGISNATAVAVGGFHRCALLSDSTVKCWGDNEVGNLGNGFFGGNYTTPVKVVDVSNAAAISAGGGHTCALLSNGTMKCWGGNWGGQLGNGTSKNNSSIPVAVSGISNAAAISASGSGSHTCALLSDGHVKCWGPNDFGQLGNGTTTKSSTPVLVSEISNATAIAAGPFHTCALLSDGAVKCWGANVFGQLGNGTTSTSPPRGLTTPVLVSGISSAIAITSGKGHTCALLSNGIVKCWGLNDKGQLGNGTNNGPETCKTIGPYGGSYACSTTPVDVTGISNTTAITAGSTHTCALLSDGHAKCWGDNVVAQLGNRAAGGYSSTPVDVAGILE